MQFSVAIILAALATTIQAAPATSKNPNFALEKRNQVNDCGTSTFNDVKSSLNPKVADCKVIVKNIPGGGTFSTSCGSPRQLVQFGTCAFSVRSSGSCGGLIDEFNVGNEDIINLINGSIMRFEHNGLVGAGGHMDCQITDAPFLLDGVDWTLHRT